jgi:excisionase family DNA binding protein
MPIQPLPQHADPQAARRNGRVSTITAWDSLPLVLGMNQVRQILGLSRDSTYALARSAGFPVIRAGRRLLVSRDGLRRWLEQ